MYKYNKNDNMTKELVWFSGQCFPGSLERLGFESGCCSLLVTLFGAWFRVLWAWVRVLASAKCL